MHFHPPKLTECPSDLIGPINKLFMLQNSSEGETVNTRSCRLTENGGGIQGARQRRREWITKLDMSYAVWYEETRRAAELYKSLPDAFLGLWAVRPSANQCITFWSDGILKDASYHSSTIWRQLPLNAAVSRCLASASFLFSCCVVRRNHYIRSNSLSALEATVVFGKASCVSKIRTLAGRATWANIAEVAISITMLLKVFAHHPRLFQLRVSPVTFLQLARRTQAGEHDGRLCTIWRRWTGTNWTQGSSSEFRVCISCCSQTFGRRSPGSSETTAVLRSAVSGKCKCANWLETDVIFDVVDIHQICCSNVLHFKVSMPTVMVQAAPARLAACLHIHLSVICTRE